ncbi:MAG: DUF4905 domain-containing protein [Fulvivirga sp.]|nr:DUF4905 domain-containing protein [Fulvivirga sp.]
MQRRLRSNFSHQFESNIWKIHAFEASNYIIIEIRDQEKLQVEFAVINMEDDVLEKTIALDEPWWASVDRVAGDMIIFFTFDEEDIAEPRHFLGYSIKDAKPLWERDVIPTAAEISQQNNSIVLPFLYHEGSEYFDTVDHFINTYFKRKITRACNYLEWGNHIIISYFYEKEGIISNRLIVTDQEANVLLDENLGDFKEGITDNTFFIFNNKLIFVKGVTDFFIYDLKP